MLFLWPAHIAHTSHRILQEKIWMLPIIFTCTHCTHHTLYPHQTKPPTMTGIYVSIIFTCTHRTHRTHYPQHLARKNMDATYHFHLHTLHTPHTLPTSVQTTNYDRNICVDYFHLHTSHTPHTLPTLPHPPNSTHPTQPNIAIPDHMKPNPSNSNPTQLHLFQ